MVKKKNCIIFVLAVVLASGVSYAVLPSHHGMFMISGIIILGSVFWEILQKIGNDAVGKSKWRMGFMGLLLLIMCLPFSNLSMEEKSEAENRNLAQKPVFSLRRVMDKTYMSDLERFLQDRFVLRQYFMTLGNACKNIVGNRRLENEQAVEGEDGWIFYKGDYSLELYQNKRLFTDREMQMAMDNLAQQKEYFSARGIGYFYIIPPNKEDVYGYKMPFLHKITEPNNDRISLLEEYLADRNAEMKPIYLLSPILAAKEQSDTLLYWKTDTHWSKYGAFVGYLALIEKMKELYPDIRALTIDDMDFSQTERRDNGDLARMLNKDYTGSGSSASYSIPAFKHEQNYVVTEEKQRENRPFIRTINSKEKYKVMVFRDSFSTNLIPYLSETFGEVIYIWDTAVNNHLAEIEQEKPDIVITETVSRYAQYILFQKLEVR